MNPRVSRSSALASKATGFPIAKIAAKLAIGYTLDEIANDITRATPAAFEPTLDYVVVKIPRFAFEKFPGADPTLTTTMKSVGEAMSIGRSFAEALGKAMRSMETKLSGFWTGPGVRRPADVDALLEQLKTPLDGRIYGVERALGWGATVEQVHEATGIDPWFLDQIDLIRGVGNEVHDAAELTAELLRRAKRYGLSDLQIAALRPDLGSREGGPGVPLGHGIRPVYKTVDTCAAEFAASTPYHYSAYETDPAAESEVAPQTERPKVIILGSGPNRIGQGIEFDYSCVHAALALRDGRVRDRHGELQPGDGVHRLRHLRPAVLRAADHRGRAGSHSRRTALGHGGRGDPDPRRADPAEAGAGAARLRGDDPGHLAGRHRSGRGPWPVRRPADRSRSCRRRRSAWRPRSSRPAAVAARIGYPVLVRPSYVLGGRGMEIVYDEPSLADYIDRATEITDDHPVLVDRFLDDAIEIDVDALCDGTEVYLGGVMEHIEEAGIHSGDSACVLPPITLGRSDIAKVRAHTEAIALGVGVRGSAERAVRAQGRDAVRAGGQPAGVPDGAVLVQGHRGAAGDGRGPDHAGRHHRRTAGRGHAAGPRGRRLAAGRRAGRGQGGGAAVPPVPPAGRHRGGLAARARRCAPPAR